jgi:hypothetical protein
MTQLWFSAALQYEFTLLSLTADQDGPNIRDTPISDDFTYESARLLLWLLTRQCEISLFRYLQNSVNQLDSMAGPELEIIILSLLKSAGPLELPLEICARSLYPVQSMHNPLGAQLMANQ